MNRPLPSVGPARTLPPIPLNTHTLSNGVRLLSVERHELPNVEFQIVFTAGAELDPADQAGRVSMMAEMLDEGTGKRDALQIAEQIDFLGAHLNLQPGWDAVTCALHVLSPRLEEALDIVADIILDARFPDDAYQRKQSEHIAALQQERDEAGIVANKVLAAAVFGDHPYGAPLGGTVTALQSLTNASVANLYHASFDAANAFVLAVGDIDPEILAGSLDARFSSWRAVARTPSAMPVVSNAQQRRIILVDKPGAAQSELRVGHIAPARSTADYFAVIVMNTILGGSFTSRLNSILREQMGVTYGASSRFRLRKRGGLFAGGAAVFTEATAESARVVIQEMERLIQERVSDSELKRAQSYIALGLPRTFESTEDIATHMREQALYGLPQDYWQTYVDRVFAVTADDVAAAAARHLQPNHATIVVVSDRRNVENALAQTELGELVNMAVEA